MDFESQLPGLLLILMGTIYASAVQNQQKTSVRGKKNPKRTFFVGHIVYQIIYFLTY